MDIILIITNLPDRKSAETLARILVQKRLVACVNILAACTSVYHWQDNVETAEEVPIFIKTTQQCYDAVEKAIKELHPYELPEIIYVPVQGGLPEYLAWVAAETIK
ncbi:divalent-cation tolerance protein CutA [Sulfurirhabdus autotrophica]|uniref:Periplasmic divalent cation tolerance protein n=1 Tax=Sulfurirhabdus autotrophica TaxID=1706046 RepID=A0A4V6P3W7_9PROT|nr:divalent-cation tolerance protein CutA [Sulfurirhabdus autotrophica]TCV86379.1 periplasmic divalent cation tolerance protein [Sulfurirhabdus autotrophica]